MTKIETRLNENDGILPNLMESVKTMLLALLKTEKTGRQSLNIGIV